ncbi:MAG: hypothetical protein KC435_14905 [Thermomicrobiales bacterium]|nr:hypothetical protein [Thermomicrobiales bacterium]
MCPHRNPRRTRGEVTPELALRYLMEGNQRYVSKTSFIEERHVNLIDAHVPIAAVLGCSDARVGAELIFDQDAGELFVVRLAGNFVSDYGQASLEYAVQVLNVPLVLVLGHTNCGAVTAAVNIVETGETLPGRMFVLIDALEPSVLRARETNPDDLIDHAVHLNVMRQVERLRSISPLINDAIARGQTMVVGAVYHMDSGQVELLDH